MRRMDPDEVLAEFQIRYGKKILAIVCACLYALPFVVLAGRYLAEFWWWAWIMVFR